MLWVCRAAWMHWRAALDTTFQRGSTDWLLSSLLFIQHVTFMYDNLLAHSTTAVCSTCPVVVTIISQDGQLSNLWEGYLIAPRVYSWRKYLRTSARTWETLTLGCHLISGFPFGPTRNFSKFHLMSLILKGSQNNLSAVLPKSSPTGGQDLCMDKRQHGQQRFKPTSLLIEGRCSVKVRSTEAHLTISVTFTKPKLSVTMWTQ